MARTSSIYENVSYATLYNAIKNTDTTSAVQEAALATLTSVDPTGGGTFFISTAEAKTLGLGAGAGQDGYVLLNSSDSYTWSQPNIAANTFDAIATLEHEISEVMGRADFGGTNPFGYGATYSLLDLFRYTVAGGVSGAAPGTAATVRDQPFVGGYSASNFSYFSYNGTTVTLQYDTPTDVAGGADIADWAPTVANDSYGYATAGQEGLISATDLEEMNVLGYCLSCFVTGTRIATLRGEVAVEDLREGDLVMSRFGGAVPVRWIGHRRLDCRRHPRKQDVWPVRVTAGAFGPGRPRRDLRLSPDHAVFVEGVLIPIRYLINDATIIQEPAGELTYWHVELPLHDVLLAEGLACESYLDTGNRGAFDNGSAPTVLHPDFALRVWEAESCAPLALEGAELVATRSALLERAGRLGHALTCDAGVALSVDGHRVRPVVQGRVHRFRLEPGACAGRIVSRSTVPASVSAEAVDHRRLGVAVSRIVIDGRRVALDDARLGAGWHPVEAGGGWRWTDGEAALDLAGACAVDIEVAMTERYWLRGKAA